MIYSLIKKVLVFFLIFIFTNIALNYFFESYHDDIDYNNIYTVKKEFINQSPNKYNTLFFGSSRTYRQINPSVIDSICEKSNIKSFNFGSPGTFNPESNFLMNRALENNQLNQVKYVFLELTAPITIEKENYYVARGYYYINLENLKLAVGYFFNNPKLNLFNKIKYSFPYVQGFILNHIFFIKPLKDRETITNVCLGKNQNGHYALDKDLEENNSKKLIAFRNDFLKDTTKLGERRKYATESTNHINLPYSNYLKNLVTEFNKNNIQLFFIIPPRVGELASLSALKKDPLLCNRIIDITNSDKYPELYSFENSFDIGHMNSKGANIYSVLLGNKINEIISKKPNYLQADCSTTLK